MIKWMKWKMKAWLGIDDIDCHVKELRDIVVEAIGIGVDVHPSTHNSWAVICVKGKLDYVKFVDLNGRDCRDISNFLRRYKGAKMCIDTPYQELFYQELKN